ncbi:MAG: 1,4-dihydroxy-2-naphthoate polyprenyltransferase [Spirochaetales bacterium]|nr:1,4-dihydroxy-2-naphthoate polyprenyltransferase [Spirochaetales bacterium]
MRARHWVEAARPKTLPASVAPVLVAAGYAILRDTFVLGPVVIALCVSILLQIGVNLANDYFDFVGGHDTEARLGPRRAAASGLIPPRRLLGATIVVLAAAALLIVLLVLRAGLPILLAGVAAIISAVAYSGGPFPLAAHGLGELFVFIFFGPVAVMGSYYVQALTVDRTIALLAVGPGALAAAILVVNNHRDRAEDERTGKRTLAVQWGERASLAEYGALLAVAFLAVAGVDALGRWRLAFIALVPSVIGLVRDVAGGARAAALNRTLAGTARLCLTYCAILFGALVAARVF